MPSIRTSGSLPRSSLNESSRSSISSTVGMQTPAAKLSAAVCVSLVSTARFAPDTRSVTAAGLSPPRCRRYSAAALIEALPQNSPPAMRSVSRASPSAAKRTKPTCSISGRRRISVAATAGCSASRSSLSTSAVRFPVGSKIW